MTLQGIKRRLRRLLGGSSSSATAAAKREEPYWESRKEKNYYREVKRLAQVHEPNARSLVDVGCQHAHFAAELDWIPEKVAIDYEVMPSVPGATNLKCDFLTFEPPKPFDLLLCMQVLEHLNDPATFAKRLLKAGRTVIITVPYRWPKGFCRYHVQDPVDEDMVVQWVGKPWKQMLVVEDGKVSRLIAIFDGDAAGS